MARKRSENTGWGTICTTLNAERGNDDRKRAARAAAEEAGKVYFRRRTTQHPTSRIFEEKGRV